MSGIKEMLINEELDRADQEYMFGQINQETYVRRLISIGFKEDKARSLLQNLENDLSQIGW